MYNMLVRNGPQQQQDPLIRFPSVNMLSCPRVSEEHVEDGIASNGKVLSLASCDLNIGSIFCGNCYKTSDLFIVLNIKL